MQDYLTSLKAGLQSFVMVNGLSVRILGTSITWDWEGGKDGGVGRGEGWRGGEGGGDGGVGGGRGQYSRYTSR